MAQAAATLAGVAQQGADLAADTVNAGKLRLGLSTPARGPRPGAQINHFLNLKLTPVESAGRRMIARGS